MKKAAWLGLSMGALLYANADLGARTLPSPDHSEEQVVFTNGQVTLAGTLYKPFGTGPFQVVVFVHGEGPESRKPYANIPQGFVEGGFAVLSYDKRGTGQSGGQWLEAGADIVGDVVAAVKYLEQRSDIRKDGIGLWGISQAGWIIPLAVARAEEVAFVILLSAPAVNGTEQNRQRVKYNLLAEGFSEERADQGTGEWMSFFYAVKDPKLSKKQVDELVAENREKWWFEYAMPSVIPTSQMIKMIRERHDTLDGDPGPPLRRIRCPMLAVYGEKDSIVPPKENIPLLERYVKEGGNRKLTVKVFPGANHSLSPCKTGALMESIMSPVCTVPGLFPFMVEWIRKQLPKP